MSLCGVGGGTIQGVMRTNTGMDGRPLTLLTCLLCSKCTVALDFPRLAGYELDGHSDGSGMKVLATARSRYVHGAFR